MMRTELRGILLSGCTALTLVGAFTSTAHAQTGAADDIAAQTDQTIVRDIVVTAQKRKQSIQEVPIVINAVNEETLVQRNVNDLVRLATITPGIVGAQVNGVPNLTVRGIGTNDFGIGADPAVALFIDGVYAGRTGSVAAGLFDVERIEVIKGPQGTLFGRSAAAGAISIVTKKPSDELSFNAELEGGTRDAFRAKASISGALVKDLLSMRIGVLHNERRGYNRDALNPHLAPFDGVNDDGVRGSMRLQAPGGFEAILTGDYFRRETRGNGFQSQLPDLVTGAEPDPFGPIVSDLGADAYSNLDSYGASLTIRAPIGSSLDLTSISAYRGYRWRLQEDDDGTALSIIGTGVLPERSNSYSQELRLSYEGDRLKLFAGGSISRENASTIGSISADLKDLFDSGVIAALTGDPTLTSITLLGLPDVATSFQEISIGKGKFDSFSVYGEATWEVTDRINLIAGLRWSRDRKRWTLSIPAPTRFVELGLADNDPVTPDIFPGVLFPRIEPPFNVKRSFGTLQPRFVLQYKSSDDAMFYVSAARGYKAGGFNSFGNRPPFASEFVWNYEGGVKADLFDRRLRANMSFFYYDYSGLQVTVADPVYAQLVTINAGSASGNGVDLDLQAAITSNLTLGVSGTWLDAQYENSSDPLAAARLPEGNRLTRAPRLQASSFVQFGQGLGSAGRLDWFASVRYQSRVFFDPFNLSRQSQKAYALADASVGWTDPSERFSVTLFGENIFNKRYLVNTEGLGDSFGFPVTQRGEPSRFGIRASVSY